MIVKFYAKAVYGKMLHYPVNDAATSFCKIAGTKTLNARQIWEIQSLGFEIEYTTIIDSINKNLLQLLKPSTISEKKI